MAGPYYVDSTATGGSNTGASWANAFLTFAQAVTAATTAADIIYVSHAHSESLAADTTYTFGANVNVLCVNSSTGALATSAVIGAQSTNYSITIAGAYAVYFYGIIFRNGTSTANKNLVMATTDGAHYEYESCRFESTGTHTSNRVAFSQAGGGAHNGFVKLHSCVFKFAATGQGVNLQIRQHFINCSIDAAGSAPAVFVRLVNSPTQITATGCDFSHIGSGSFVGDQTTNGSALFVLASCKLGSGMTIMAAQTTVTNLGSIDVSCYNCDAGDVHYAMFHGNALGQTTVSAAIYANDGASYDGTNRCSWKIVTTANCSYYYPYISTWFDKYHSGTSAITPRIEILRDGSATKYQNDEVWGEFSYQGTSGFPLATIVSDRMVPLGSAADQADSALGSGDWTGENATAAFQKLEATAAITPAEIGHLRARVCVGEPSITVYVDPTIRTT